MQLNLETGWFEAGVRIVKSPHFNERPNNEIDMIVVHSISLPPGQFGGQYIDQFFLGKLPVEEHPYFAKIADLKVSAHLFISRQGEITQYVSLNDRAWHAGQSSWNGRENCNDFSVGIELEGMEDMIYTQHQYRQLTALTQYLMERYPAIEKGNLVRHSDIAPGRKLDPGPGFKWGEFKESVEPTLSSRVTSVDLLRDK
jgi:N-acetyl-anhydromuramoyl-L-alanine amidase